MKIESIISDDKRVCPFASIQIDKDRVTATSQDRETVTDLDRRTEVDRSRQRQIESEKHIY